MPHIQQLESHVADLIAAGEVVERPASVVKELVENAIDAGATAVAVEIRGGGMSLIRVTDDGCGIAAEELPTAFLRHATSKLRSESDLGKIGTLGFRGEALAAISAVSRVDILTRRHGAEAGSSLHLEGGVHGEVLPAGTPEGTAICVRDLFYNTPARPKCVKNDSAETAAVKGLMQHLSLSHPDVSFKLTKDGTEALHTPGDGKLESAVYAALGREFARSLLAVNGCGGEIGVGGFVTKPLFGRGSRGMQTFFVNGRFIKSQLLTAALEEGYRNQIMKGRFPGCVLEITLPVTAVDVNVHPAKTVVKFAREHDVFDAVYHTVLDTLDADGKPAAQPAFVPKPPQSGADPRQGLYQSMDAATFQARTEKTSFGEPARRKDTQKREPAWDTERHSAAQVADSGRQPPFYRTGRDDTLRESRTQRGPAPVYEAKSVFRTEARGIAQPQNPEQKQLVPAIPAMKQEETELPRQEAILPPNEAPWRIAGEILRTYIICETGDGTVYLIDKHAAHERVNFDRLKKAATPPESQRLLRPIAAELSREDAALLLENFPLLAQFGFECEAFGGDTVLVRAVPADIRAEDTAAMLEEFAGNLRSGRDPGERREALLRTMACKAAIKAGMDTDPRELRVLVDKVQSGEIKYCPHGRPVAVKVTKYELEKKFGRA